MKNAITELFNLTGKTAFVTGANSGIGKDACIAYAQAGANVILLDIVDATKLATELSTKYHVETLSVIANVGNEKEVEVAVATALKKFPKIDILLNNAGIAVPGTVDRMSLEKWEKAMNVNVTGIYLVSKYVLKNMISNKAGRIINVASIEAVTAEPSYLGARHVYNTSKGAVRGLTIAMAATYGYWNITVNSIGPGLFLSEMTKDTLFKTPGLVDTYNKSCPLHRPGNIGELNGTIIYLSSAASSYVTGQHILIDGGYTIV